MERFTPGPWTFERRGMGHGYDIVGGSLGETIVYDVRNSRHEKAVANARLIAAAPDLLTALQAILHTYDDGGVPLASAFEMANAAIAKAVG